MKFFSELSKHGQLALAGSLSCHGSLIWFIYTRSLSNLLVLLQLRERERRKADFVAAAGDGGLLRLRWLECRREVAETAGPWPADVGGRFGPSRSRVWSPGIGVEAEAAAAQRNKSSQAFPRPGDAPLRRRRRVCGGGAPGVEPLYRSHPTSTRRPGR